MCKVFGSPPTHTHTKVNSFKMTTHFICALTNNIWTLMAKTKTIIKILIAKKVAYASMSSLEPIPCHSFILISEDTKTPA